MTFRQDLRPRPQEAGTATSADLERLARVVRSSLGIDLQPAKSSVVRHRLGARMRELGLSSLGAYLDLIEAPWAEDERDKLISATTTNVTHFFREAHHFDMFERDVLPGLIEQTRGGRVFHSIEELEKMLESEISVNPDLSAFHPRVHLSGYLDLIASLKSDQENHAHA